MHLFEKYDTLVIGMQFDLSDDVMSSLIFAMENQNENSVFDSMQKEVVELGDNAECSTDRYYRIPEWTSIDGFKVMEHFVASLHSPQAKELLQEVLFAGKGVFRNFKNTLKDYPEVERQWFAFKQRVLKEKVVSWYNVLRDSWGLQRIEGEPEETENLIFDDFMFREYNEALDKEHILLAEDMAIKSLEQLYTDDLGLIVKTYFTHQMSMLESEKSILYCCFNIVGDFSGVISVAPLSASVSESVVVNLFFVLPAWRGLGLGKELLMLCLHELKKRNIRWVILPEMFVPKTFTKVLLRSGFVKTAIGFTVDLNELQ